MWEDPGVGWKCSQTAFVLTAIRVALRPGSGAAMGRQQGSLLSKIKHISLLAFQRFLLSGNSEARTQPQTKLGQGLGVTGASLYLPDTLPPFSDQTLDNGGG